MRAAKLIAIYAAAIVGFGAAGTPWVFKLVHPLLPGVPFRRLFDRVALVVAVVGLWPLLRGLGSRSWRDLGFPCTRRWWQHTLAGLGFGIASFLASGVLLIALGARRLDTDLSAADVMLQLLKFIGIGIAVALVEETLFRGGLQNALQRAFGTAAALIVASSVYSAVHFLKPKGAAVSPEAVTWLSGVDYLGRVLRHSMDAPGVAVGFVTLFLVGLTLGWAFAKTRALYFSMGLHAGWVMTLKTFALLTSGGSMINNAATWPVLVVVLLLVAWLCRAKLGALSDEGVATVAAAGR